MRGMTMSRSIRNSIILTAVLSALSPFATAQVQGQHQHAEVNSPDRIRDIRVSAHGSEFHALVMFNAQPKGAKAQITETGVNLKVTGLTLDKISIDPLEKALVRSVQGNGSNGVSTIEFTSVQLSEANTTLYRQSVLISGVLAKPAPSSQMADKKPHPSTPPQIEPGVKPQNASKPEPALSLAATTGLGPSECTMALNAIEQDPWNLPNLGAHAVCLVQNGDFKGAQSVVEQLDAFAPEDWRASLAKGELHLHRQEISEAVIAYRMAIMLCDDASTSQALTERLERVSN